MLDDATVLTRLESELHAALTHVAHLASQCVAADLTAARVLTHSADSPDSYACAGSLGLSRHDEGSLRDWIGEPSPLFTFIQERELHDAVFRPREMFDEAAYARQGFFRRLEGVTPVRDAVCATFGIGDRSWCALALLRCGDSDPFPPQSLATVDRLRPAFSRVIARAAQRETAPRGTSLRVDGQQVVHRPASTAELLAKLSKTELHVLNFLRSHHTEREIADQLGRSPHTVHVHVKNIYRKFGVSSRKHLTTLFGS